MQFLALALVLLSFSVHAELYRWIDRPSGSVKYSSTPPPWYGDAAKERANPPVEVIRSDAPGTAAKPTPKEQSARITAATIASMEARWRTRRFRASSIAWTRPAPSGAARSARRPWIC